MRHTLCVSSSIKPFREKAEKAWGLERYEYPRDKYFPVVFFGMYHIGDYWHFIRHAGKKIIVWAGSDILNLLRWRIPARLFRNTECYCENQLEWAELRTLGIKSDIAPTFLEDINDFKISYKPRDKFHVYLSVKPGRENEYGLGLVNRIAPKLPEVVFHIFGEATSCPAAWVADKQIRIFYEGTISNKEFNENIKNYHCGLRTNEHDGFSEITAKSALMGQYPVTKIYYPYIDNFRDEEDLIHLLKKLSQNKKPNKDARIYYRQILNDLPFIKKSR